MPNILHTIIGKISILVEKVMTLQSDDHVYDNTYVACVTINDQTFYFGPFHGEHRLHHWAKQSHIDHLKIKIIRLDHPDLPREDWPI